MTKNLAIDKIGAFGAIIGLALLGLFLGGNIGAALGAAIGLAAAIARR